MRRAVDKVARRAVDTAAQVAAGEGAKREAMWVVEEGMVVVVRTEVATAATVTMAVAQDLEVKAAAEAMVGTGLRRAHRCRR